ncbi:exo-beta-N-acetylmuramidase NamZ domain-containing protein [Chlorobium sp. KB01]|uniref:exo-beta-N-acetylmuramidase NamZ family protein n=1 Tax=Chlorobium sp. KB01 TaxID=1917528 RepID=UPI00097776F1|nr:DUF1343 domain-containing protein [Chlorobium sp. KB01]
MTEETLHPAACSSCAKMVLRLISLCTFSLLSLFLPFSLCAEESLRCGIDRLEASGFRELSGMMVGLVTNAAGVNRNGEADYLLMLRNGVNLKFLMAPEHGFAADVEAGRTIANTVAANALLVYSLYGATKKPDPSQLKEVDILVFDLQDVGSRCYTYISTMKSAMEACEEAGIAFMVLDRPNPVIPLHQEGFMVEKGYDSFVGAVNIPFVHAMTVGEIALLLKEQRYKKLDLRVITMQRYSRDRFGDEYAGFRFVTPSPNIRNVNTALLYPATVFLEATTISEGRGTDAPFMQFGAPFINSSELALALNAYRLAGVSIQTVTFTPRSNKYQGELCHGLKLSLTDRKGFRPFRTAAALLLELERLYPGRVVKDGRFFDLLAGTPRFREMITRQMPLEKIMEESFREIEQFNRSTPAPSYLYR